MQFSKKVWRANEKASAGTFLPPGSGLATPALVDPQSTYLETDLLDQSFSKLIKIVRTETDL